MQLPASLIRAKHDRQPVYPTRAFLFRACAPVLSICASDRSFIRDARLLQTSALALKQKLLPYVSPQLLFQP